MRFVVNRVESSMMRLVGDEGITKDIRVDDSLF